VGFVAGDATVFDIAMWPNGAIWVTGCALGNRWRARVWFVTASASLVSLRRRRRFDLMTRLAFGHVGLRRVLLLMATSTRLVAFVDQFAFVSMTSCARWRRRLRRVWRVATSASFVAASRCERGLRFMARLTSRNARLGEAVRFMTRRAFVVAEVERDIAAGLFVTAAARNGFAWCLRSQRARRWMDVVTLFAVGDLVIRVHIGVAALTTISDDRLRIVRIVAAGAQAVRLGRKLPKRNFCCMTRLAARNFGFLEHVRFVTANAFIVFASDDRSGWNVWRFDLWILVTTRTARRCHTCFFMWLMTH